MMWTAGMGPGMWVFMALGTVGFWILVTMLVRTIFGGHSGRAEASLDPSPLHLLADRLARGEITVEEYEQRRRALTRGAAPDGRPDASPMTPTDPSALPVPDPTKDRHRSS